MRTLYLVRHDTKAWKNGRKPASVDGSQHDPPLASELVVSPQLQSTIDQLQGVRFESVFCSPFLRTRQTATHILSSLHQEDNPLIRTELGEYLGNHRRGTPHLSSVTLSHYPNSVSRGLMMSESIMGLEMRVKRFMDQLPSSGVFLIVSHGLVLSKICGLQIEEGTLHICTTE
jgi:broad specificity phosphatase PhoE